MEGVWEIVYTVTDYYDGVRGGVADYDGKPHVFESPFDANEDGYVDTFRLKLIDGQTLTLVLEAWEIWRRWETAFHSGTTSRETHPALPEDKSRSDELASILKDRLEIDSPNCITCFGEFRRRDDPSWSGKGHYPLEVMWTGGSHRRS